MLAMKRGEVKKGWGLGLTGGEGEGHGGRPGGSGRRGEGTASESGGGNGGSVRVVAGGETPVTRSPSRRRPRKFKHRQPF